jgi:hypothetical protein
VSFTYEEPPATPTHEVRFWSTDTVERPYSASDEDIAYLLTTTGGSVMLSAALVCDRIADYWSTSASATGGSKSVGPFTVGQRDGSDLEAGWRRRASRLRTGSPSGLPLLSSGVFTGDPTSEFSIAMQDNGVQSYPARSRSAVEPPNGVW